MKPPPPMTRRAFAAHVQASLAQIQRLVARGAIPLDEQGKIPMPAGLHAYLNHRQLKPVPPPPLPDGAEPGSGRAGRSLELAQSIHEAELAQKAWDARTRELRYRELAGELVQVEEVRADARAACEAIRSGLLALGPRIALQLEAICAGEAPRAPQIQAVIDDEVNALLITLHSSRFAGAAS